MEETLVSAESPQTLTEFRAIVSRHIASAKHHSDLFREDQAWFIYEGPKNIVKFHRGLKRFKGNWLVSRADMGGSLKGKTLAEALYSQDDDG